MLTITILTNNNNNYDNITNNNYNNNNYDNINNYVIWYHMPFYL